MVVTQNLLDCEWDIWNPETVGLNKMVVSHKLLDCNEMIVACKLLNCNNVIIAYKLLECEWENCNPQIIRL